MPDMPTYLWSLTAFRLRHQAAVGVDITYRNTPVDPALATEAAQIAEGWNCPERIGAATKRLQASISAEG